MKLQGAFLSALPEHVADSYSNSRKLKSTEIKSHHPQISACAFPNMADLFLLILSFILVIFFISQSCTAVDDSKNCIFIGI